MDDEAPDNDPIGILNVNRSRTSHTIGTPDFEPIATTLSDDGKIRVMVHPNGTEVTILGRRALSETERDQLVQEAIKQAAVRLYRPFRVDHHLPASVAMAAAEPPRAAEFALSCLVTRARREEVVGDAAETFAIDFIRYGPWAARCRYVLVIANLIIGRGASAIDWLVGVLDKMKRLG